MITYKTGFFFSVKEGAFRQFKGSRATKDFLDFIEEKQWEKLEAVTGMADPGGFPMGVLGFFFKLSYAMKDLHKVMTEDYKFSTWISYAFFTLVTILVGGLLGLVRWTEELQLVSNSNLLISCFRWLCCAWTVSDSTTLHRWLLLFPSRQVYLSTTKLLNSLWLKDQTKASFFLLLYYSKLLFALKQFRQEHKNMFSCI